MLVSGQNKETDNDGCIPMVRSCNLWKVVNDVRAMFPKCCCGEAQLGRRLGVVPRLRRMYYMSLHNYQ